VSCTVGGRPVNPPEDPCTQSSRPAAAVHSRARHRARGELLDVEPGQEINLERVLLVADGEKTAIGQPVVADATVSARVLRRDRGEKTISFKYRPKARRRVKKGHRQELTVSRSPRFGWAPKAPRPRPRSSKLRPRPIARRSPRRRPGRPRKTLPSPRSSRRARRPPRPPPQEGSPGQSSPQGRRRESRPRPPPRSRPRPPPGSRPRPPQGRSSQGQD